MTSRMNHPGAHLFDAELFGRAVRAYADQHVMSLRQIARKAGVSAATICRTGSPDKRPDVESFARLCAVIGVPIALFFRAPERTP